MPKKRSGPKPVELLQPTNEMVSFEHKWMPEENEWTILYSIGKKYGDFETSKFEFNNAYHYIANNGTAPPPII